METVFIPTSLKSPVESQLHWAYHSYTSMVNYLWFLLAALLEISGCFAFWMWLRLGKSIVWLGPGILSLGLFAMVLTQVEAQFAGRAYAAYGGIYIVSSLAWLSVIEKTPPSAADLVGAALCLIGGTLILFGPNLRSGCAEGG